MSVPSLKKLKEYIEFYTKMRTEIYTMSKTELYHLKANLRRAMRDAAIWKDIINRGRRKLKPENKVLINRAQDDLQSFELELVSHIFDLETEENLHNTWKTLLLPEPVSEETPRPQYMVLSPKESNDLSKHIDESWFPVRISGKAA